MSSPLGAVRGSDRAGSCDWGPAALCPFALRGWLLVNVARTCYHEVLVDEELLGFLGRRVGDVEPSDPGLARATGLLPFVVTRARDGLLFRHLVSSSLEEVDHVAPGEEIEMRLVEQAGGLVGPVALQQRAHDGVVADVGDAGDEPAVWFQPVAGLRQERPGSRRCSRTSAQTIASNEDFGMSTSSRSTSPTHTWSSRCRAAEAAAA